MCLPGMFGANCWALSHRTHPLPGGFFGGELVGTFKKYPAWTHQVKWGQIVSELTMNSQWACWVSDPSPPVRGGDGGGCQKGIVVCLHSTGILNTHWGQGPKYPPGTYWIHWEYRQQVTPMCPVGTGWVHFKCPLLWDSNLPRPEQAGYI